MGICRARARYTSREHFDVLILLEGTGSIGWAGKTAEYAMAQVWMIPAALGGYELAPSARTSLMRTYVPGDLAELGRNLAADGVSSSDISRLIRG